MRTGKTGRQNEEIKQSREIRYISRESEAWPDRLLPYERMPRGLYVIGSLPDPEKKSVAIVGARACSAYGRAEARRFARELAEAGVQIISGMACGIDGCAHEGALEAGGRTFAVLGSGVDVCYPRENIRIYEKLAAEGGLLSEYMPGTQPLPYHFPIRNRIISGLADLVLVVEARLRSGSLITADYALEQGKSIWAIPGKNADPLSQGCNRLIAQGAGLAMSPDDILEELGISRRNAPGRRRHSAASLPAGWPKRKLSGQILKELQAGEKTMQDLRDATGADPSELSGVLMQLCLYGYAEEITLGYYAAR